MKSLNEVKLSIIGVGAMGGALTQGLIASGILRPENIIVSDPDSQKLKLFHQLGVKVTSDNKKATQEADLLVVAVKPWLVKDVIEEIKDSIDHHHCEVCFIVAGVSGEEICKSFGQNPPENLSVAMPNTAMIARQSMTFIVPVCGQPSLTVKIFDLAGKTMVIPPRLLPGAMSLASCGIAYAMRYVRAACEGGVELGFRASEAQEIIVQTLTGAVALLSTPGSHPETEIDKVTTPGGITIKGLNAMEKAGFTNAVIEGLKTSANA